MTVVGFSRTAPAIEVVSGAICATAVIAIGYDVSVHDSGQKPDRLAQFVPERRICLGVSPTLQSHLLLMCVICYKYLARYISRRLWTMRWAQGGTCGDARPRTSRAPKRRRPAINPSEAVIGQFRGRNVSGGRLLRSDTVGLYILARSADGSGPAAAEPGKQP
jgi:hypothetical protein